MARFVLLLPFAMLALTGAGNPAAPRFTVAGITLGMKLPAAVAEMRQTFAAEALPDVHIMTASSHPQGDRQVVRLAIAQQASSAQSDSARYAEDRFKLRLAGPPTAPVVTALARDYLAPAGLARASLLRTLLQKYGPPTSSTVPDATVAPDVGQMIWVVTPAGGLAGGGAQSSTDLRCGAALSAYDDYFDNAGGSNAALAELVRSQQAAGCGLVLRVEFAFNAVHYMMYDSGVAAAALGSPAQPLATKAPTALPRLRY